jgi:4-amino-4-deoxy-L-arabinose transferase-like glycosyltransferase
MSAVIGLGFVVRLVFLYTTRDTGLMIVDEQHYHTLALNVLLGEGFAWAPGKLTSARPPFYPAFMALIWFVSGTQGLLAVRVAQIVLALANVYLLFRLGVLLFDRRTALLAAAGLSFYPSLLGFNYFLLTETLFTFLLTSVILGVVVTIRTAKIRHACSAGMLLGVASLTRSVLWPFPALLCPFIFFVADGKRSRRLWIAMAVFFGYAVIVLPWAIRNTRLQGVFTVIDTLGGITLRMGNYEYTSLYRAWDPATLYGEESILHDLPSENPNVASWSEGEREKWALKKALTYMFDNPGLTLQRSFIKLTNFWGLERTVIAGWQQKLYRPPKWFEAIGTLVISLSYIAVMLLACFGIFRAAPGDQRSHIILLLVIGFIATMHAIAFGHERYHLPLIPFLLLYAAAAIIRRSWQEIRPPLRPCAAPLAVGACLFVLWAREVLIVDTDRIQILLRQIFG